MESLLPLLLCVPLLKRYNNNAILELKIIISPNFIDLTIFRDNAIFQNVSVATLLTYKHNNVLLDGLSIKIANTLDKNAGIADAVKML